MKLYLRSLQTGFQPERSILTQRGVQELGNREKSIRKAST